MGPRELDRFVAAAGLADDLIALFFEELLEVEPDDRLVFGDHHAGAGVSGSHRGGRPGSARRELGGHAVEQRVLLLSELGDREHQGVAVATERVGVTARVAGFGIGERRLGNERARSGVFGFFLEERELLLGDRPARRAGASSARSRRRVAAGGSTAP